MEFLGWSSDKPTECGWYWHKQSVDDEDWKAQKIYLTGKTPYGIFKGGFWKPASAPL